MVVTVTIGYECRNTCEITKLICHTQTCTNRKVAVIDPKTILQYKTWAKPLTMVNEYGHPKEYDHPTPNEIVAVYTHIAKT
jgi:hypothetical protein